MFVMLSLSDPARSFSHSVSSARESLLHAFFAARYPGQEGLAYLQTPLIRYQLGFRRVSGLVPLAPSLCLASFSLPVSHPQFSIHAYVRVG